MKMVVQLSSQVQEIKQSAMTPNHMPKKSYDVSLVASQNNNASRNNARMFPHSPISFNSDAAPS